MNKTEGALPRRQLLRLAAGTISVVDEGRGLPVLLGHSLLWDAAMWEPQIRELRKRCRVLVPEMWGHGESGALPPGTRTMADLADEMIELLDRLEVDRCVVIGSSMGGMWGAHLAARAPERVAGLVLMNSYLGEEPTTQRSVYAAVLDEVAETGEVGPHLARLILPLFFGPGIERRAPALPAELNARLARFTPEVLRRSIVPLGRMIFGRSNALAILPDIVAPSLVIAGAEDRARPTHESGLMAELLECPLAVIPACGHTATLEQPLAVNAALLRFLEQLGWIDGGDCGRRRACAVLRGPAAA